MNILIVDDEENLRGICERALRAPGRAISTAASAEEALPLLDKDWDIVVTDVNMPGAMGGLDVLRRAKEAGSADVLMMTGNPELSIAIGALKLGAYDFIVKPFTPETLQAAVERCLEKRRLSVELAREKALRAELERMQKIKETFGLFVTPEVAEHVLSLPEDQRARGVSKTVTVLFADVRGFTPFAAASTPEASVETLNEIFARAVTPIQKEGGVLNKFMGDGLLALFGAPVRLDGHEKAAARAAIGAMKAIEAWGESRRSRGLPPLRVGMAINTGQVVAGCLGTRERTEYSVIGHAVNLAARLEENALPGQILLGPETARALEGAFLCRKLEPMKLQGLDRPVAPSELVEAL